MNMRKVFAWVIIGWVGCTLLVEGEECREGYHIEYWNDECDGKGYPAGAHVPIPASYAVRYENWDNDYCRVCGRQNCVGSYRAYYTYSCSICGGTILYREFQFLAPGWNKEKGIDCNGAEVDIYYPEGIHQGVRGGCDGHEVPNTYWVDYSPNGGSGFIESTKFTFDESNNVSDGTGFERDGYTLIGWALSASETSVKISKGQSCFNMTTEEDAHITLHAIWRKNEYSIIYRENTPRYRTEMSGEMPDKVVPFDEGCTLDKNKYSAKGYTFEGWAITPNSGVTYVDEGYIRPRRNNLLLFAVWNPVDYEVVVYENKPIDCLSCVCCIK